MANTIPPGGAGGAGGTGTLSPQAQAQMAAFMQQLQQKTAMDNQAMIAQSQAQLDQMTGGIGKLGGPTGFENLANNMLGPVTGGGPNAGGLGAAPGAGAIPGAIPGATPGLGTTPGLDPTGGLGTVGGIPTPALGGLSNNLGLGGLGADPTGLGAGNLTQPMNPLMGF